MLLLPEVTTMPTVTSVAIVIVLVLIVVQLVPLVDRAIAKLLPVRVTRTQQFGGVIEVDDVLVGVLPVVVRRMARMLLLPEPRCTTEAKRELTLVVSRTITPTHHARSRPDSRQSRRDLPPFL